MSEVIRQILWRNETGVTASHAGNVFLEGTGSARSSWVKKKDWTGLGGTRISGAAESVTPNNAVDTLRGWPNWRAEHIWFIDLLNLTGGRGCDEVFLEWRGEIVSASGFGIGGGGMPANFGPTPFYSKTLANAHGAFTYDTAKSFQQEPPAICYNKNQRGTQAAPMAGETTNNTAVWGPIAGNFPLHCRGLGNSLDSTSQPSANNDLRAHFSFVQRSIVPVDNGWLTGNVGQGALLWGHTAQGTGGSSRFPTAGDQLGAVLQVGYAVGGPMAWPGTLNVAVNAAPLGQPILKTTGLAAMWVTIQENAPATGVTPFWLDFATGNATMTFVGMWTAILIRH